MPSARHLFGTASLASSALSASAELLVQFVGIFSESQTLSHKSVKVATVVLPLLLSVRSNAIDSRCFAVLEIAD